MGKDKNKIKLKKIIKGIDYQSPNTWDSKIENNKKKYAKNHSWKDIKKVAELEVINKPLDVASLSNVINFIGPSITVGYIIIFSKKIKSLFYFTLVYIFLFIAQIFFNQNYLKKIIKIKILLEYIDKKDSNKNKLCKKKHK